MCFSICNRSFILLLSILILFSSCGISKKEYHNDISFLNSENAQLQEEVDKLQAVIDSLLLLKIPIPIDSQIIENRVVDEKQKPIHVLIDREIALQKKDSLLLLGWNFQDKFPFFYKKSRTGSAPKSCSFSPNGEFVAVTLLNQNKTAVEFFETGSFKKKKTLYPSCNVEKDNQGYAEGLWRNNSEFWFTRMTTGDFFVWYKEIDSLEYFDSKGVWTKIIQFSPDKDLVAMSHWVSNSITVFDINTKTLIREIKTGKTPRGIVWFSDSIFATALFGTGDIEVYNVNSGEIVEIIKGFGGNARDLQYDSNKKILYYSNMGLAKVYKYDWENKKHIGELKVDYKPNTIRLSPDRRYLFVSCRGPNNPEGYTKRSPRNGDIFIIDTKEWKILTKWRAGNQPTGLDLSSCGRFLAQTDFQDRNITLWLIAIN